MAKKLIGVDKYDGALWAYDDRTDAIYRAKNPGLGDLGEALWEKIFDSINKTGIPAALAERIKGKKNPYQIPAALPGTQYNLSGPGVFGSINPVYLLLAGGLGLFLLMKR